MTQAQRDRLRAAERSDTGEPAVRTIGVYEEKEVVYGKITKKPWYVIDPREIWWWDATTSLALLFTAVVTPFEV